MISSSQIREQLTRFLNGSIDLATFEEWLLQNTWNIHQGGSDAAESLTFAVEEALSEHSSGHITEQQLRKELHDLVQNHVAIK
jgi:hypothetical protein